MKQGWLIILILSTVGVLAQKPQPSPDLLPAGLTPKHQLIWIKHQSIPTKTTTDIASFVRNELGYGADVSLKLDYHRQSQTLDHFHFSSYFKGIRILGGEVQVAVEFDGRIKLIQAPETRISSLAGSMPKPGEGFLAQAMLGAQEILKTELVLISVLEQWVPATYVQLAGPETLHREVVMHEGEIVFNNDLIKHSGLIGPGDTTVNVRVFDPDPLTTAQQTYGGKYIDDGDKNSGSLNAERKQRTTTFTLVNGLIKPENDFVKITEFSAPITAVTAKTSPDFNYTRDKDQFEDVNVVYHITQHRKHIQSLGYPKLPSYQVHVDAHALSGSDQSFFATSVFPYRLYFGEGGVDDAEDADVILHEFSHAVVYEAAPNGSKNTERKCIEEAICDYFAASYSREVSNFGANDVFNWDGHNEFWPGRSVSTTKLYAQASFKNGNYYAHTDLMASSLNELYRRLGRSAADQLVLEACYLLTSSTAMPDFGKYVLISDSLLNGAANIRDISESFVLHGILNLIIGTDEPTFGDSPDIQVLASNRFTNEGAVIIQSTEGLAFIGLFDINGREIMAENLNGDTEFLLKGDDYHPGVYMIHIESRNGQHLTQKLLRH